MSSVKCRFQSRRKSGGVAVPRHHHHGAPDFIRNVAKRHRHDQEPLRPPFPRPATFSMLTSPIGLLTITTIHPSEPHVKCQVAVANAVVGSFFGVCRRHLKIETCLEGPPWGTGVSPQRVAPRQRVNWGDRPDSIQDHGGLEGRPPRGGPLALAAMVPILRAYGVCLNNRPQKTVSACNRVSYGFLAQNT